MLPPAVRDGGLSVDQIFELFPNLKERLKSRAPSFRRRAQMLAIGRILRTGARLRS
jgi:branched-chain amino acid transport system ATP-binding protein